MLQHHSQPKYKFTRRVKGKFQARVWDGRLRAHVNLGLYDEDRAAWDASKRFFLKGELPAHILPHFVRQTADGSFVANVALGPAAFRLLRRVGPFQTACEAHVAMLADLLRFRIDTRKDHDPRRLINADNPAIASYCVLAKPWAWTWPVELLEVVGMEMVEECQRRIDRGGGYAEAARRWATAEHGQARRESCAVVRCPQVVIARA